MAKNEILKISDFQSLGLCDGFAKLKRRFARISQVQPGEGPVGTLSVIVNLCELSFESLLSNTSIPPHAPITQCTAVDSDTGQPWCATATDAEGWVVDHRCAVVLSTNKCYFAENRVPHCSALPLYTAKCVTYRCAMCRWGDCGDGCPGTVSPCDERFFSLAEGG